MYATSVDMSSGREHRQVFGTPGENARCRRTGRPRRSAAECRKRSKDFRKRLDSAILHERSNPDGWRVHRPARRKPRFGPFLSASTPSSCASAPTGRNCACCSWRPRSRISCVDPLAEASLEPLAAALRASAIPKILHAARQDLEVLWPAFGPVGPVFDTQIAAGLTGLPAQIGYSDLVQRLLGVSLAKAETPHGLVTAPAQRGPAALCRGRRGASGTTARSAGREAGAARPPRLAGRRPARSGQPPPACSSIPRRPSSGCAGPATSIPSVPGSHSDSRPGGERRASDKDRPRSWILDDNGPAHTGDAGTAHGSPRWPVCPTLRPGFVERSGAAILAEIDAAQLPERLPPLPQRSRPDPERQGAGETALYGSAESRHRTAAQPGTARDAKGPGSHR